MFILGLLFMQTVEYVECNEEYLILMGEEITYNIDFFNVIFYEESNLFRYGRNNCKPLRYERLAS